MSLSPTADSPASSGHSTAAPAKSSVLPELLAPAGGMDAALAAFHFGADAIYLGLRRFSARAEAQNFSPDELAAIVAYAHGLPRPRRVYAAVNTLILESELPGLIEHLALLSDCGADGVIVQDFAAARLISRRFPALALHASTQMAVHSKEGVIALKDMGFHRVVLSRELTLSEIAEASSVPGIETEVFVHGALCYAVSGLCLCSSHLTGKSGNRGACTYPCRDLWRLESGEFDRSLKAGTSGRCFSMKDLSLEKMLRELSDAGVSSLKIEGRKKSPLYVAAAVDHYRHLLDETVSSAPQSASDEAAKRASALRTIFSRPWTELFLRGRRNPNVIDTEFAGHRGEPVGKIAAIVRKNGRPAAIRFTAGCPLERHDGLQIEIPGEERPFGFGIGAMKLIGPGSRSARTCVTVPARAEVEVSLPADAVIPAALDVGLSIRLASSNAVKRSLAFAAPSLARCRPRTALKIALSLSGKALTAVAETALPEAKITCKLTIGGPFEVARDPSGVLPAMRAAFERLGSTSLTLTDLTLDNPLGLFVQASRLNAFRRDIVQAVEASIADFRSSRTMLIQDAVRAEAASFPEVPHPTRPRWILRVDSPDKLHDFGASDFETIDELQLELSGLLQSAESPCRWESILAQSAIPPSKIRWVLPAFAREDECRALRSALSELIARGARSFEAENLSALTLLKDTGLPIGPDGLSLSAGWQLYVLNSASALFLRSLGFSRFTLSPEDSLANWRTLPAELLAASSAVVFQDTPLFISESCPHAALLGQCPGKSRCSFRSMRLVGSRGQKLDVYGRNCRTFAVSASPLNLTREIKSIAALGTGWLRADFAIRPYAPAEVLRLWRSIRSLSPISGGHSANFHRGFAPSAAERDMA